MRRALILFGAATILAAACSPAGPRSRGGPDAGGPGLSDGSTSQGDSGRQAMRLCNDYPYSADQCSDPEIADQLRDLDSDKDGLTDFDEICTHSSDPCRVDSNGNGVSDLIMVAAGLDPTTGTFPPDDFALILPYNGSPEERTLQFGTEIQLADVYFLIDTTGSMGGAIANVRTSLSTIAAALSARIPDVELGVGRFDDFPFNNYGAASDVAYAHLQDITPELGLVQTALDSLTARAGGDGAESYTEAVYQTASGLGGDWTYSGSGGGRHTIPPRTCPSIPDEVGMRRGYPCFRPGALPVVVMVGDATWHNDHAGQYAYSGISPSPATFDQAADALNAIGGRFIGVWRASGGRATTEEMSRRTGSVDGSGTPLFYLTSDGRVSEEIINGIETLVGSTPQDVDTTRENVPGNPDEFDATLFIKAIVPVEGYRDGVPGANPGVSYASKDETTFYEVIPGTTVRFRVDFHNDVREPGATAEVFRARINVMGNGVARLDTRQVYIVVPPDGGVVLF